TALRMVSTIVVDERVAGLFRAEGALRVVLATEVAAVRAGPPQPLAVAGHGGQDHIARQVVPSADAEVLAHGAHAGVVARFGEIVLAVAAAGIAGHDRVRVVAIVAVRDGADQRGPAHPAGQPRQMLADASAR